MKKVIITLALIVVALLCSGGTAALTRGVSPAYEAQMLYLYGMKYIRWEYWDNPNARRITNPSPETETEYKKTDR